MHSEQPVFAPHGMVACAHYLATQAGVQILAQGGNAIDAAIAANAVMTVVYPTTCSAGGDIFLLIWDAKTQKVHALNGSGRAPQGATPAYFAARGMKEIPTRGPLSINVPGAVDGWFEALERFGSLPVEQIFAPAIALAEDGMPVTARLSAWLENSTPLLSQWAESAATYLPGGRAPRPGERLRQPNLARTYRTLVREGRDALYHGPIGREIADYIQRGGGVLSMEDLEQHHSDWVTPLTTTYREHDIYEFPPNSQGMVALEMLNILEGYDLNALGYQSAEYLHLLLEAKKLAFADRDRYLSDPAFVEVPVERLLSKEYAARQRERIDPARAMPHFVGELQKDGDTMYLCTADNQGNVVSLIQSLYMGIGSGLVGGNTGIALHNRGSYFSLDPRHVNYLQPGKRTMHTLMPGMVLRDGHPSLAVGTMGGDAQPQIHVQLLTAMLDFGLNPQQAISAPRWASGRAYLDQRANQPLPGQSGVDEHLDPGIAEVVEMEDRFPAQIPEQLTRLGHHIQTLGSWESAVGHAQAIAIDPENNLFSGAADPRCDGLALGY
ncbi:MAG TPA: gamma-glutamyltransferase [Ktedonobacteraceae bacterium]